MRQFERIGIIVLCCMAGGCATPYQPLGFGGGYEDLQLTPDTFSVKFSGNRYLSKETTKKYMYYRASELTVQNGYQYFIPLSGEDSTQTRYIHGGNSNTYGSTNLYGNNYGNSFNAYGSSSFNTTSSGYTIPISKPELSIMIKCLNEKPDNFNGLIIDANFYLQTNNIEKKDIKKRVKTKPLYR